MVALHDGLGLYELLEHALKHTAASGDYLLEPSRNIFEAVADEQPLFKACMERESSLSLNLSLSRSDSLALALPPSRLPCPPQVRSPDGVHRFSKYE
eukprot:1269342-Pleurochrysis_carterae.AAC.1